MKHILSILTVIFSALNASAGTYEIIGPCSQEPVVEGEFQVSAGDTVSSISQNIFTQQQIPFEIAGTGFSSILGTPTGIGAIEYVSPSEIRAYGWCYSVDGLEPAAMPGEFPLDGSESLRWWFAFSRMVDGKWVSYCEPAYTVNQPAGLCK